MIKTDGSGHKAQDVRSMSIVALGSVPYALRLIEYSSTPSLHYSSGSQRYCHFKTFAVKGCYAL